MDFPVPMRKPNRLTNYDYSQNGAYFVTICTQYKRCIFGTVRDGADEPVMHMNEAGKTAARFIEDIPLHYPTVEVTRYCVMPNHVHLLLTFGDSGQNPSLSNVINQFKGAVTKALRTTVWQKGFHDRVVRDLADYRQIGEYIEHNPAKWRSDIHYVNEERA